ncbi:acyltransferase family protein [Sandaracinobacteroides sp. A072]|uniref:acyltransferase family protein n=1 Tax=Sandaracinobacteroides sp. A072 TaxID=3461146 RepID=UPI004042C21A
MATAPPTRFEALDSLRGVCALLVCLFHFEAAGPLTQNPLVRQSWLFVDFFFVLSGFVIAHSYGPRLVAGMPFLRFSLLRFMRVYPLHLVMLLLFVAVEALGAFVVSGVMNREPFTDHTSPTAFVLNLVLLHCFGLLPGLSWNHPSWSIASEFWTYLLYGAAAILLGRLMMARRMPLLAGMAALAMVPILLSVTPHGLNVSWDHGLIRCIYGFSIGVIGHRLWERIGAPADRLAVPARSLLEFAGVGLVCLLVVRFAAGGSSLLLPPVFLAALLLFAGEGGLASRLLRTRFPMFLGTISYGIYMVHVFVQSRMDDVIRLMRRFGGPDILASYPWATRPLIGRTPLEGALMTVLMLALVILASWLAYRLVEQPGIRLGKRMAGALPKPGESR